jgi:NAD(P)-dependent dehydrogenase (short-subunit alcohol dehydrogenase family)
LEAVRDMIVAAGGSAIIAPADLRTVTGVDRLVETATEAMGGIDILVNCAGMNRRQSIAEVTPETFDEIMNVNLRSAYFLSRAVAPGMGARGGGKIVHIGSINAAVGLQHVSVYGLSKSALVQTTKVMAIEWAELNIQVNCLCPGFIRTELTEPLWRDERRSRWILDRLPTRRPGLPEDLVGMAIYLAGPASAYTTGQAFYVDGGFLAGSPWA